MTLEELRYRIEKIKEVAHEDGIAHSHEDDLREDVLLAIADGAPNAIELAREVLKTGEIEFERRCT